MGQRLKAKKGPSGRLHLCRKGRGLARCGCVSGCCQCVVENGGEGEGCQEAGPVAFCGPPKCCCGKRWRFRAQGRARAVYTQFGKNTDIREAEWDFSVMCVSVDLGFGCSVTIEAIEKAYVKTTINGVEQEHDSPGIVYANHPEDRTYLCRGSLAHISNWCRIINDTYLGAPGLTPFGWNLKCAGDEFYAEFKRHAWGGSALCPEGSWFHNEQWDFGQGFTQLDATASGEWSVERLDAACCGDAPDGPVLSSAAPGANPFGNPGNLTDGGGCPRCGADAASGKCHTCGWCGGCGG